MKDYLETPPDPVPLDSVDIEAQLPCSSRSTQPPSQSMFHNDPRDEQDPFKIRALLDNMKQMVAADVPQEKPYEYVFLSLPYKRVYFPDQLLCDRPHFRKYVAPIRVKASSL